MQKNCCDGCDHDTPAGWSKAKLEACIKVMQCEDAVSFCVDGNWIKAAPGDWLVRIPALDMTVAVPKDKFDAAFRLDIEAGVRHAD